MEVVISYLQKYVFQEKKKKKKKKIKKIKVKAFNRMTNKDEAEAMTEHISCDCKCKFNSTTCNLNRKQNTKTYKCECKNYRKCKKDYAWNPSTCICETSKYLKNIADTSVIACDKILDVMDIVLTKKANTIAKNVSINCQS